MIWQCDILQRTGFPLSVKDVTTLAEMILRKRDPTATISPGGLIAVFVNSIRKSKLDGVSSSTGLEH